MALYKGFFPNWLRLGPWNIIVSFNHLISAPVCLHIYSVMQCLLSWRNQWGKVVNSVMHSVTYGIPSHASVESLA